MIQKYHIHAHWVPSYGVYISKLVRSARIYNNLSDFDDRNFVITDTLLHQGYRFHKLLKNFTQFYYHADFMAT
jgi:hypothetical protein